MVKGEVHQLKAPEQMLEEGWEGGWREEGLVEGEVHQVKAPLQMLVVGGGG